MTDSNSLDYIRTIPSVFKALEEVHRVMDRTGFNRTIRHLVLLRASQINGCAYCVTMHTREAREDGETSDRLDRLVVWKHASVFLPDERAALAWTEALTSLGHETDYGALRAELQQHFSNEEIGVLTVTAAMINLWNRIQVSGH